VNTLLARWSALAWVVGTLTVLSAGCAVVGGGYGYDGGGIGAAYYEPYGIDVGGWGGGYQVAPYRGGGHGWTGGGGQHAYRSAPASRAMPSLPSGSRSGGGRSGGSRSGGGRR
jgi:hypothetical protein